MEVSEVAAPKELGHARRNFAMREREIEMDKLWRDMAIFFLLILLSDSSADQSL